MWSLANTWGLGMQKSAGTSSCNVYPNLGDFQSNGRVGSSCKRAAVEDVTVTIEICWVGMDVCAELYSQ